MKSVVVIGGAGFIGSHLTEKLVSMGQKVIVVDNLSFGKMDNLQSVISQIEFFNADIRNKDQLLEVMDSAETVFHLAALKAVPASFKNPKEYHDVNINGTFTLLEAALEKGVSRVIFSSSSSVYGDSLVLPKQEAMCPNPLSPYALTKLAGEYYIKIFSNFGLDTVSLRYFNVYGPKQNPESEYAAVIPKFITSALSGKDAIIYGDGEQTRDFSYVDDVVSANIAAFESSKKFAGKTINIAGGKRISINQLFEDIKQTTRSEMRAVYKPAREGDIKDSLADISLAKKDLSWQPEVPLSEGIGKTTKYFQSIL